MSLESQDCAFCEIVAGRAPAHVVEEDALSLCLLDIHPFTEGHCLVISKRHVPWWHDLGEEEIVRANAPSSQVVVGQEVAI